MEGLYRAEKPREKKSRQIVYNLNLPFTNASVTAYPTSVDTPLQRTKQSLHTARSRRSPRELKHPKQIQENFGVPEAYIVYDQPPDFFRAPTIAERHKLFARLESTNDDFSEAVRALTAASSLGEPGATGSGTGGDDWWPDNDQHDGDDATTRRHPKKARGAASRVTGGGSSSSDSHVRGAGNVVVDATATSSNSTRAAAVPGDGDGRGKAATIAEDGEERTLFTRRSAEGVCELRRDRPALLLSSTSWTPDEDFSVLLEALRRFDSRAVSGASPTLPLVMVVVTGKGPDKAKYVERMRKARMSKVAVCTAWLEPEDYPVLLGSADLGVCLHTSTSGERVCALVWVCLF